MRSPEFHQIMVVDGEREWQKNDGDYFPQWLDELAVAMVQNRTGCPTAEGVAPAGEDSEGAQYYGADDFRFA